jgi:predicted nucleotidyltransferase
MIKFEKLPSNILSRIPAVREVLSRDQRVPFAYLCGGFAEGSVRPLSEANPKPVFLQNAAYVVQ